MSDYNKAYYIANKSRIQLKNKVYYELHRDEILEKNREYSNNYYQKHRDFINQSKKELVDCPCGKSITRGALSKHFESKYHQQFMKGDN